MVDLFTRLSRDLAGDLRALSLSGPRARGGLRTATATVAATLVALFLHLDNPWWAGITGVVLIQGDVAATLSRSLDRVIGTTIGATIGYVGAATIADHVLFLALSASCVGFVIYAQERAEHGYAFLLGGITIVLILFGSLADPTNALHLAFFRTLEIYIGVITVCAVDAVLAEPADTPVAPPKPGVLTRPIDHELVAIAVTGGLAVALIPLIWETLQLPGLAQTPITAFVILTAMRQEPGWRVVTRIAGCFLGGVYGLVAMHFVGDAFLPWIVALFVGLFFFGEITHGKGDAAVIGVQAGIAIVVSMILGDAPSYDITPGLNRLIGVFGGVSVVALCLPLLSPLVHRVIAPRG